MCIQLYIHIYIYIYVLLSCVCDEYINKYIERDMCIYIYMRGYTSSYCPSDWFCSTRSRFEHTSYQVIDGESSM